MNLSRSRNHRGRFRRTLKRSAKGPSVINIRIENPAQFQRIYRNGVKVVIAVSDDTCPHCVKYKPTWNTLAKTEGRNVPMISMPSSVYNQTELAKQKEVKGVPTVLYVSPNGTVNEVEDIRDEAKMTSLLKSNTGVAGSNMNSAGSSSGSNMNSAGSSSGSNMNSAGSSSGSNMNSAAPKIPTNIPIVEPEDIATPKALQIPGLTEAALPELPTIPVSQVNRPNMTTSGNGPNSSSPSPNIVPTNAVKPVLPGVTTQPNPLTPLPGTPVPSEGQSGGAYTQYGGNHTGNSLQVGGNHTGNRLQVGGNPWSAFMMAAKQAAPTAVLLGAYSMMPRSSGLGRPRYRKSRSRSRKSRTQRRS